MEIISQAEIIQASTLEEAVINCKNRFSDITDEILSIKATAHEVEKSIFNYLMELGYIADFESDKRIFLFFCLLLFLIIKLKIFN